MWGGCFNINTLRQTDSSNWESVTKKDHFFKDVEVIKDVDEFIKLINRDRVLIGLDVAKYILSKVRCTHLKLEKLVYLCYADYLCRYDKKLFIDKIYAYKYGPVIETVYEKYKVYGYNEIRNDDKDISATNILELPSKSRILFAEDGIRKIGSIDKALDLYGNLTASELVDITHRKNTPWDVSGSGQNSNRVISDIAIKKLHCNENIY